MEIRLFSVASNWPDISPGGMKSTEVQTLGVGHGRTKVLLRARKPLGSEKAHALTTM